jgi:hypothetical protein
MPSRCVADTLTFEAQAAKAYGPIRAAYKDRNRDALDKRKRSPGGVISMR